jgi:hypothetical protein
MHDQFHTSANGFAVYGTFSRSFVLAGCCHHYETDPTTTTTTTTTTKIKRKRSTVHQQQNFSLLG